MVPVISSQHKPGVYAEFRLGMLAEDRSLSTVRSLAHSALMSWGLPQIVDDARVVINELATNGIEAAPGHWMEIAIELQPDGVLLTCWDCCPDLPFAPELVDFDAEGGRGLFVVAMYSAKHGTTVTPDREGKAVWAVLATGLDREAEPPRNSGDFLTCFGRPRWVPHEGRTHGCSGPPSGHGLLQGSRDGGHPQGSRGGPEHALPFAGFQLSPEFRGVRADRGDEDALGGQRQHRVALARHRSLAQIRPHADDRARGSCVAQDRPAACRAVQPQFVPEQRYPRTGYVDAADVRARLLMMAAEDEFL